MTDIKNIILPFSFDNMPLRGKLVRLNNLERYIPSLEGTSPDIREALTEMTIAACLLMDDFKTAKSVTLQIQNPQNQSLMVVQCESQNIKAYTNRKQAPLTEILDSYAIFSITAIEKTGQQYQSLIPLANASSIVEAVEHYFSQSVQSATLLKITHGFCHNTHAAGALFIQALPEDMPEGDDWNRVKILFDTLKADELVPGKISPTDVLFRLFHEDTARLFPITELTFKEDNARPKMLEALKNLGEEACRDLLLEGFIEMIDEYTGVTENFTEDDIDTLFKK